jgi:hypothetical protein
MPSVHACLAALIASLPLLCAAQYKCVGADGKTSFQQMPCDNGASSKRLEIKPSSGLIAPADKTDWAGIIRNPPADSPPSQPAARNKCPTPAQIREMEFEASKIGNRLEGWRYESLQRARNCR